MIFLKIFSGFLFLKKNVEDVANFDVEFTSEKPVLTPPKEVPLATNEDQILFKDFDFFSELWAAKIVDS